MGDSEEAEEETPVVLEKKDISSSLSMLAKTVDGTGVVFTKLDLPSRKIADISLISNFSAVRHVDLSNNLVTDMTPLHILDHMITLNISHNKLTEFSLPPLSYIQTIDASHNSLATFDSVECQYLRDLNLSFNALETVTGFEKNPQLQRLNVDNNKLTSCNGLGLETLKELSLHMNQLGALSGLEGLVLVKALDVSDNPISSLAGTPTDGVLRRLTLKRGNLTEFSELEGIASVPLDHLDLSENPIADGLDRVRVLRVLPSLQSLNEAAIEAEERAASLEPVEAEAPPTE